MTIILRAVRHILRCNTRTAICASSWRGPVTPLVFSWPPSRGFHTGRTLAKEEKWGRSVEWREEWEELEARKELEGREEVEAGKPADENPPFWEEYKETCALIPYS